MFLWQERIDAAEIAVLLYATDPENEWSAFTDKMAQAVAGTERAASLFADLGEIGAPVAAQLEQIDSPAVRFGSPFRSGAKRR